MEIHSRAGGRIVIPWSIRRKLEIKEGTRIHVEIDEQTRRIILTPITRKYIHSLRGLLKGGGALKTLMAERRRESGP
jgi:AbrB family looped-hinge helix DNA binding protein